MRFPEGVPTLTDGRVTLRAHTAGDVRGTWEQCQDPVSQRWTTVPVPYSMADAREFVEGIVPRGWRQDADYAFVVEAADADGRPRFSGSVSLRAQGSGRYEIAYGSHPWCRGTGVMEAALRLLLRWGFEDLGARMVVWWANKGNWASRKLAWRLGFTVDGTVRSWLPQRGELLDGWVGTLLRDEPVQPRSAWYDAPVIHGDRVVLRPLRDSDAARIHEAGVESRMQHWFGSLSSPYTLEDAKAFLETRREQHASGLGLSWAVADPTSDELLGNVTLFDLRPGRDAEIGFWAHPDARGRGVTTEACRLALRHAFVPQDDGGLGLLRVRGTAAEGNAASVHVLLSNGFQAVGRERGRSRLGDGTTVDLLLHDVLAHEWVDAAGAPPRRREETPLS